MAVVVEVRSPGTAMTEDIPVVRMVEVIKAGSQAVEVAGTAPQVEVVSSKAVTNVVVSPTPPASPYEGQVWIDIS